MKEQIGTSAGIDSVDALKQWSDQFADLEQVYNLCISACKTAVKDMQKARDDKKSDAAKAESDRKEKEETDKKRAEAQVSKAGRPSKRARKDDRPSLLRVECQDEDRIRVIDPDMLPCLDPDFDFTVPMQFSKQTWLESMYNEDKSELKQVIDDFC